MNGDSDKLSSETLVAEVVKIAKDAKNINNIRGYDDVDATKFVFDRNDVITLSYPSASASFVESPDGNTTKIIQYKLDGTIKDSSVYGYERLHLPLSGTGFKAKEGYRKKDTVLIFFDSLPGSKEVVVENAEVLYEITGKEGYYRISDVALPSSSLNVSEGKFDSNLNHFELQLTEFNEEEDSIEIHNVKLPAPKIETMKISFNDRSELTQDGLLRVDNDLWSKYVKFNSAELDYEGEQPAFLLQNFTDIKSNCVELYDENEVPTGLMVTMTIGGLKKFGGAENKWKFKEPVEVLLSSEEMVEEYKNLGEAFICGCIIPSASLEELSSDFPEYRYDVKIGDTVISGENFENEFNTVSMAPITSYIDGVGECIYIVNPPDSDKFQLELLVKPNKENSHYKKYIYYANLPTDRWYNLSLYKYQDKILDNESSDGYSSRPVFGLSLTDVTGDRIYDVTSKSKEIFNCYVSNENFVKGDVIESELNAFELSALLINGMHKYDSMYNLAFDPCSRYPYDLNFTTDSAVLKYKDAEITETEYQKKDRKRKDLFKISDDLTSLLKSGGFMCSSAVITLFDNMGVDKEVNSGGAYASSFIDFEKNSSESIDYDYNDIYDGRYESFVASALVKYAPRRVFFDDSDEYYMLTKKDMKYHVSPVPGMKVKSVMWIDSPDFSNSDNGYTTNENDSLQKLKDFRAIFDNPQMKLPPVKYSQKILNSDYATMIYNSCLVLSSTNIDYTEVTTENSKYTLDYSKDPKIIAYVWGNSQVSKNDTIESLSNEEEKVTKLHFSKMLSNYEYIAEIGSIYNYENKQNVTNIVIEESTAPSERQAVILPTTSNPLKLEKRSNESSVIRIVGDVIATAALGYTDRGYSKNAMLNFKSTSMNNSIEIDTTQNNYLYLVQNEGTNNCSFGSTMEKPVYVDEFLMNPTSLAEGFEFFRYEPDAKDPEELDEIYSQSLALNSDDSSKTVFCNYKYVYDYSTDNVIVLTGGTTTTTASSDGTTNDSTIISDNSRHQVKITVRRLQNRVIECTV